MGRKVFVRNACHVTYPRVVKPKIKWLIHENKEGLTNTLQRKDDKEFLTEIRYYASIILV